MAEYARAESLSTDWLNRNRRIFNRHVDLALPPSSCHQIGALPRPSHWRKPMRFMIIVKSRPELEGVEQPPEMYEEMGRYNQSLVDAGILLAAEGLTDSKDGAIVTFKKGGKFEVKDGPFTEAKELVAGFWIIQ